MQFSPIQSTIVKTYFALVANDKEITFLSN
jgi:hypothetical protein